MRVQGHTGAEAKKNAVGADYRAYVHPPIVSGVARGFDRLFWPAARHIAVDRVAHERWRTRAAHDRQAIGHPLGLSARIHKDVTIAHMLEPRRGPPAQFSLRIVAVHGNVAILAQLGGRKRVKTGERQT